MSTGYVTNATTLLSHLPSWKLTKFLTFFKNRITNCTPLPKKTKCDTCSRNIKKGANIPQCTTCNKFNHLQCVKLTKKNSSSLPPDWQCNKCCTQSLPFSEITNDDFLLTVEALDKKSAEFLKNVPSFSIQTLIDKLPGQKFDTDEFISDTVESKYHTPAQFIAEKFSKKSFKMFHMNIASLQAHIDELRNLLSMQFALLKLGSMIHRLWSISILLDTTFYTLPQQLNVEVQACM